MIRRILGALLAASALAAASPAAASAYVVVMFSSGPEASATVDAFDLDSGPLKVELVRDGAAIATATGPISVSELQPGDTARAFAADGTLVATATYDGTPAILGDVCIGSTSFRAARSAPGSEFDAGASSMSFEDETGIESTIGEGSPAVVTLSRPLAAGDGAYAMASSLAGEVAVVTAHIVAVKECATTPTPPVPEPETPTDPQPPEGGDGPQPATLSMTTAGTRLKRLGLAGLRRSRTFTVPVTFSEPGAAAFKLVARGKVIGNGTRTGDRRVTIRLTAAGRKLLKRATRVRLTLKGTFTPSRAGEVPQRASVSVTLRR